MKRFWPSSLKGQVLLAIAAALLLAQGISAVLLYRAQHSKQESALLHGAAFRMVMAGRNGSLLPEMKPGPVEGRVGERVAGDEVEQVFVGRAARGTGLAAQLLVEAERQVAASGHHLAWLAVVEGNARAQSFYRRRGFADGDAARSGDSSRSHGGAASTHHRRAKRSRNW